MSFESGHRRTTAGSVRAPRWLRKRLVPLCAAGALTVASCSGDFHLSAVSFSVAPTPAAPGDLVVATFILNLIPPQRHTMVVYIDDEEHLRVTEDDTENPVIIPLGDAAELIDRYGTGEHVAFVLIEAGGERARTDFARFQLNAQ